jgi:site-specific DNA-methyltransferase (adenine-specific)
MTITLHEGDCLAVIPQLVAEGIVVDAIVTDPPYHLLPTVKRFQAAEIGGSTDVERRAKSRSDGLGRLAGGFMGQQWDGGDIAFRPETWATIGTALRPGGFLLAFGGTRTHHRVWCAIEDAGFVIQDTIMFLFGTGFPKRRDMLKPAFEPICVAYKPGGKRTLQVDECRIPTDGEDFGDAEAYAERSRQKADGWARPHHGNAADTERARLAIEKASTLGRWPANIVTDGSDEVMEAFAAFDAPGQQATSRSDDTIKTNQIYGRMRHDPEPQFPRGDAGSAARFFYYAKADGEDRWGSRHPTVKPVELLKWLVPLVTPKGGTFLDPFAGSGTAAVAALATGRNAILIEQSPDYCADIRARIAHYQGDGQHSLSAKARHRLPSQDKVGTLL